MFSLLFSQTLSLSNFTLFRGNWSETIYNGTTVLLNETEKVQISVDKVIPYKNITCVSGRAIFSNTTFIKFPKGLFKMAGIRDDKTQTYFMFSIMANLELDAINTGMLLDTFIKEYNITDPANYSQLHKIVTQSMNSTIRGVNIFSVVFQNHSSMEKGTSVFDIASGITGNAYFRVHNIQFRCNLYDYPKLIKEGNVYGVFTAFCVILSFFGWTSVTNNFASSALLKQLSWHSFVCHVAFEFAYSLFIFDLSLKHFELAQLFSIIFLAMITLYFTVQMRLLAEVMKSSIGENADVNEPEARPLLIWSFSEVAIVISVACVLVSIYFSAPLFCGLLFYSYLIPQIIHTAKTSSIIGKKKGDEIFIIFTAISRLFPILYFSAYRNNIVEEYSPKYAIFITVYLLIQVIIILLQNRFGGLFFVPKSMRPIGFNYSSGSIPDGAQCAICMAPVEHDDDAMVTPCSHVFHAGCLRRWMEEELVCPLCRAQLPAPGEDVVTV